MPAVLAGFILLANRYGRSGVTRADSGGRAATSTRPTAPVHGSNAIPEGYGVLTGALGPRLPGQGAIPELTLQFTDGRLTRQTKAVDGRYRIALPAGTWSVREAKGRVCAQGILLSPGGVTNDDLVYGMAGCQSLGG